LSSFSHAAGYEYEAGVLQEVCPATRVGQREAFCFHRAAVRPELRAPARCHLPGELQLLFVPQRRLLVVMMVGVVIGRVW